MTAERIFSPRTHDSVGLSAIATNVMLVTSRRAAAG
jgi:hypothetical protein